MQVEQDFQLFTFSEKTQWSFNDFDAILASFWSVTNARTHGRTEDKPAQRDPLHALGTHPVCGRRPPTPILVGFMETQGCPCLLRVYFGGCNSGSTLCRSHSLTGTSYKKLHLGADCLYNSCSVPCIRITWRTQTGRTVLCYTQFRLQKS